MLILAADPGSTSTKIAVYEDERRAFEKNLPFPDEERAKYETILAQLPARCAAIASALSEAGFRKITMTGSGCGYIGLTSDPEENERLYRAAQESAAKRGLKIFNSVIKP